MLLRRFRRSTKTVRNDRDPLPSERLFAVDLKQFLKTIDSILSLIQQRQLDRLFLMRDSQKCQERLIHSFQQKKSAIDRNRFQQKELTEKASNASLEEQQLKDKLNQLVSYTKQLKEQVR